MSDGITKWQVEFTDAEGFSWLRLCVLEDGRNPLEEFPLMLSISHYGAAGRADDIEITAIRKAP
ncbi:hypothetical protein AB0O76_40530 [Streptomyces sp. NPDC086554]|uniref:hypothetical protein n=1 Tax=Streptomyces sp. NPDC086554 TaxID=3154864 RepID=UPI003446EF42